MFNRFHAAAPVLLCFALPAFCQLPRKIAPSKIGQPSLTFEPNAGQAAPQVRYLARGGRQTLFLTDNEAVLSLLDSSGPPLGRARSATALASRTARGASIRMTLRNTRRPGSIEALDPLAAKINYFIGNDPSRWRADVPTYGRIAYRGVYPGVDLVYYGRQGALEYDFVAKPGANTSAIQIQFEGAERIFVNADGDLTLETAAGPVRWKKPYVYQDDHGVRRQVAASYRLTKDSRVGFELARYDRRLPLVIDPVLVYSTFLGGNDADIGGLSFVDSTGIYIAGITYSFNFPTTAGAFDRIRGGTYDCFIAKLNPQGTAFIYSTYLGGTDNDGLNSFRVQSDGSIYLAGFTASGDFPTVTPVQQFYGGGQQDGFIAHLSAGGNSLISSTYLGGIDDDDVFGMAVDSTGVYVCGETASGNYPVTAAAFQHALAGGKNDAFLTKLALNGSALQYSTFFGGSGDESLPNPSVGPAPPQIRFSFGCVLTVDSTGAVYLAGVTTSTDFPTTPGAYSRVNQGGSGDGYVAKFNSVGTALLYSTLIGGSGFDVVETVFADSSGGVLIAGVTGSTNFPTTPGAFSRTYHGGAEDGFVARLDATGASLLYSTFFGGSEQEASMGADVASNGNVLLSGLTYSTDFPTTPGSYQTGYGGAGDIFISLFDPALSRLIDSTYLGGSDLDIGGAAFATGPADIMVSGQTASRTFPTTAGAYQRIYAGGASDAFFARFTLGSVCSYSITPPSASAPATGSSGTVTVTAAAGCPWTATSNAAWLGITSGSQGTGNGAVAYSVQANTGSARAGTITIAGQTFTVNQSGAPPVFTISPPSATIGANGGLGSVAVNATPPDAAWTATTNSPFIFIQSGASGTGNGVVTYSVNFNGTGASRSGTMTIAGQTFTITQTAAGVCSFAISPPSVTIGSGAGTFTPLTGSFSIFGTNCAAGNTWTAISNSPRLVITSATTGNGGTPFSTITWSMFTNSTTLARTAQITVAGQAFTVLQAGTSENQSQRVVRALYQTILGREPDSAGFNFWTGSGAPKDAVTGAVLFNQMADGFYVSPEFKNSGWLALNIYQAVTGALPNFSLWLSAVMQIRNQTLTPTQLTNNLAGPATNASFVQNAYLNGFGRSPSAAELNTNVANLNAGQSKFDFLNTVIFPSTEFTSRTNPQLVQALYYTILVRDVDSGGFSFWLSQLDSGQAGIYYLYNPQPVTAAYLFKLAVIGQAAPPNPQLLGFLGSPEFQGLIQ